MLRIIQFLILLFVTFVHVFAEDLQILKNPIHIQSINFERLDNGSNEYKLKLEIAKDHFVYVDDLQVISELDGLNNANFEVKASPIIEFKDKFSGGEIKKGLKDTGTLVFLIPFGFDYKSKLSLSYRACTNEFCYLPKTLSFDHLQKSVIKKSTPSAFSFGQNIDFNNSSIFYIFIFVFLAGILTSFTPCIFPLIPITLTIIQNNVKYGKYKSFQKTFIFVSGIAITYSILGLIAATSGSLFGSFLANPYALISISLIYFLMALSLFGFFEIQMLGQLQNKFSNISTESNLGVFAFGVITGIFASPCVGPVLIGILTYAAQSKNLVFSFFLLFIYAMGIGQIFLILSLFSNLIHKLPKSGSWLNVTKYTLGTLLIIAGLFFLVPGIKSIIQSSKTNPSSVNYIKVLNQALQSNKITMVDFRADWCAACKELEHTTFKNSDVKKFLDNINFLKIDVTSLNDNNRTLIEKYKVIGLPHILFFDKNGNLLPDLTISSYINAEEMLAKIKKLP